MKNKQLVEAFGRVVGAAGLTLSAAGSCDLTIGDDIEMVLGGDPEGVGLTVDAIVDVLSSQEQGVLAALLRCNLDAAAVGDGFLGLDGRTGELVLRTSIATGDLTPEDFTARLEDLARRVLFWREQLPSIAAAEQEPVVAAATDGEAMIMRP